ncbi:MAG: YdcF family protein [Planctomycetota bacterium]
MSTLVVPPLSLFLLAAAGLLLARWRRRAGRAVATGALLLLVLLCVPAVAALLLRSLECAPPLDPAAPGGDAAAIVVLGADMESRAPEYGGVTLAALSLERARYAARLHHRTGEPVLVTGGPLRRGAPAIAALVAELLREELGVPVRWVEASARNTWENAALSAPLLAAAGVRRIHLVTHAWHMRRAAACFSAQGLEVVPAPTGFRVAPRPELRDFLPSAKALRESSLALHEWIGIAWYALRRG